MKKETLVLIGAGALAFYFYQKSKNAAQPKQLPQQPTATQQKQILSETFGKYLPQAQAAAAAKPQLLQKGLKLVTSLFKKKKVSGLDECIGLY